MSKTVRLGLVGLGGMGYNHATNILSGKIARLELTAMTDKDPSRFARLPQVKSFDSVAAMAASGQVDAVLIATPTTITRSPESKRCRPACM